MSLTINELLDKIKEGSTLSPEEKFAFLKNANQQLSELNIAMGEMIDSIKVDTIRESISDRDKKS